MGASGGVAEWARGAAGGGGGVAGAAAGKGVGGDEAHCSAVIGDDRGVMRG